MARLLIKTPGLGLSTLELRLGVNRVGRDPKADFTISHPTVSTEHCELILSGEGVLLHDCDSTNGSFVNGQPVTEIWLEPGQQVRFGDVELTVESTEANIAIPKIDLQQMEAEKEKPLLISEDGVLLCPRHSPAIAVFQCLNCGETMCMGCVRMMRRQGGKPLFLCLICHNKCERIVTEKQKTKKSFLGFLQDTVRFKFGGKPKE